MLYSTASKSIHQNQQELIWKLKEEEFYKKDFYIKSMEDILETIKSQRHDLNNYLSTLYGLIYLKKFDDAKKYINKLNTEISNLNIIIDTNHPIVTALVSIKKNKAFDNGINMNLDIELPKDIDFEFVDLSIVIGNLLDNAIEACQLIPRDKERGIEFKIHLKEEILKIKLKNTKLKLKQIENKNITGRFTTKADDENHGYGLGNIEFIVKQYNGNMEISDLGNEFIIDIDLPVNGHMHSIA
jgi:sensor histidine kinase regulating citrate/malate metabolism